MAFSKIAKSFMILGCLLVATVLATSVSSQDNSGLIPVRLGQHPDYSRIVFDFPVELPYRAVKEDTIVTVIFDADFGTDLNVFGATNLRYTGLPTVEKNNGQTIFRFTVADTNGLRHFRSNSSIVIDILETPAPTVAQSTVTAVASGGSDEEASQPNNANSNDIEQSADDVTANVPEIDIPDNPGAPIGLSSNAAFDQLDLFFDLPSNAGLAVFERAGTLWVVFDRPFSMQAAEIGDVLADAQGRVTGLVQDPNVDATVLRLSILEDQSVLVSKDQLRWTISFKDSLAKPRFPLIPIRRVENSGSQIFVPVANIGRKIEIEDPNVGDLLSIIPVLDQGRGVAEDYSYSMANILETSQGVVVIPLRDDVRVERFREGVSVAVGNIQLTGNGDVAGDANPTSFKRLVDFRTWRQGEPWEYNKIKGRLLYELSLLPDADKNLGRWKLAQFYLAHKRAPEALGVLGLMEDDDPTLAQNAEFLAIRGVAKIKLRRFDQAEVDLSDPALSSEQDIELWRTLISQDQAKYDDVLNHYRLGQDVIGTYDDTDKAEIQLAVIGAALKRDDLDLARSELQLINGLALTSDQLDRSNYLNALYQEKLGNDEVAMLQYGDLSLAVDPETAAYATLKETQKLVASSEISNADAIDRLVPLSYKWRGRRFEVEIATVLADLFFAEKRYSEGFEYLKQARTYNPTVSQEFFVSNKMINEFVKLFLDGGADELPPVEAIALFTNYQELTPPGVRGDTMIRRLSDRLVSLDLLDRAAELLQYQVTERLEGAARAQIAGNLAKIYILDRDPDKAIDIIRVTREPRLPKDIEAERMRIESRALIEKKRYEEALVLVDEDRSLDADRLRADIYWGSKDWQRFIAVSRRVLGDGWRTDEALDGPARLNLTRLSIAMTFTEDRGGLRELRQRYGTQMRTGEFASAFVSLTGDEELSGRELGAIASEIASVEKLQTFLRDYRADFSGP